MKKLFFCTMLSCLVAVIATAQVPFTPGNIVVSRIGDGAAPLASSTRPVFLDEYSPSGTLIQSIALPTATAGANHMLTLNGTNPEVGALTLSPDKQYLAI